MQSELPAVDSDRWRGLPEPRLAPGRGRELSPLVRPIVAIAGRVTGGPPPNIFATLARHSRLFAGWLAFASQLMPRGRLPRADTELVILRVAWNMRCRYEWDHHVRIGARAGLDRETIERVAAGPDATGWSDRQRALLSAVDELHADRFVADDTWARVREHLDSRDAIELCMLVGHYEMIAMTVGTLGIQPEAAA